MNEALGRSFLLPRSTCPAPSGTRAATTARTATAWKWPPTCPARWPYGTPSIQKARACSSQPLSGARSCATSGLADTLAVFAHAVGSLGEDRSVTAQSAHEYDPDDPVEILRVLPGR